MKVKVYYNWRRQWHPTPVLLPGKFLDRGAWWATVYGVAKESDMTEQISGGILFKEEH